MKNNTVEVVFILDMSGSMYEMTTDTIGGFNSVMADHRKKGDAVLVSTVLFNTDYQLLHDRIPVSEVPDITENEYRAGGGTALIDAIGSSIKHIEEVHRYIRPEDVPDRTLFMITTDGFENSSHIYSSDDVKQMITAKQEKGWEFVFLAANIDAVETAKEYGIKAQNAVSYHNDSIGNAVKYEAMSYCLEFEELADDACLDGYSGWRAGVDKDFNSRK